MTLLATVTFDLHGASPDSYSVVKNRLSRLKLENKIKSKKSRIPIKLPANTFIAEFERADNEATDLRDYLRNGIKKIIREEGLKATIFITIGHRWAWGKGKV
jgi:hypothetical protein